MTLKNIRLREPWWAEIWSGVAAVLWAMIAISFNFHLINHTAMRVLISVCNESIWYGIGLFVGIAQVICVVKDDQWPRWFMSLLALGWWTLLLIAVFDPNFLMPSLGLYATFVFANFVSASKILHK